MMPDNHGHSPSKSRTKQAVTRLRIGKAGVGYRKPPQHTRFKPGRSGNPNGRPKNSRNLKTIIQQALTERIVVREGEKKRTISKIEGVVLRQVEGALKGNDRAALATLKIAAQVGLLDEPDEMEGVALTVAEQQIVDGLLQRNARRGSTLKSRRGESSRAKIKKRKAG